MALKFNIEMLSIHHSVDIYEIMQMVLKREKKLNKGKEHFWTIALSNANKILNLELVSFGSTSSTVVKPVEVLSIPVQKKAAGIILVHNHPSGKLEPSEEDRELTDKLIQACKLMNTPVLDHVIITEHSYYSFKSSGLLEALENSNKYVLPYDLERQYHEEMQEAIQEGIEKNRLAIAQNMLNEGFEVSSIQKMTGLTKEAIESLKEVSQLKIN